MSFEKMMTEFKEFGRDVGSIKEVTRLTSASLIKCLQIIERLSIVIFKQKESDTFSKLNNQLIRDELSDTLLEVQRIFLAMKEKNKILAEGDVENFSKLKEFYDVSVLEDLNRTRSRVELLSKRVYEY